MRLDDNSMLRLNWPSPLDCGCRVILVLTTTNAENGLASSWLAMVGLGAGSGHALAPPSACPQLSPDVARYDGNFACRFQNRQTD